MRKRSKGGGGYRSGVCNASKHNRKETEKEGKQRINENSK